MSIFNPDAFLEMQVTDANSTVAVPPPAGEFVAFVEEVKCRPWQSRKDPSIAGMALDLVWNIDDAGVKQLLERDKVTVKQGIMLDLTDSGGLDMGKGKNVGLGRLREALGLNTPGQPFSFQQLAGRPAKVVVSHRTNPDNPDQIFAEVKAVAKLA